MWELVLSKTVKRKYFLLPFIIILHTILNKHNYWYTSEMFSVFGSKSLVQKQFWPSTRRKFHFRIRPLKIASRLPAVLLEHHACKSKCIRKRRSKKSGCEIETCFQTRMNIPKSRRKTNDKYRSRLCSTFACDGGRKRKPGWFPPSLFLAWLVDSMMTLPTGHAWNLCSGHPNNPCPPPQLTQTE